MDLPFYFERQRKGGKLYLNLHHQNKRYRKRYGSPKRTGPIKNCRLNLCRCQAFKIIQNLNE
ncbi:hypothetical protein CAB17_12790 [Legionella sainthelensi]|uniref:Uncharacterized protein n=1 Tax=Legionella sainthelensi TaxID=28087 RepID=A0A2H5FMN6_9GAMM|nr:hypothetical protein CAB17_12790 [Legionella sainthelensi]